MTTFKVGDRVRVYDNDGIIIAKIVDMESDYIGIDNMTEDGSYSWFHSKQCRKLKSNKPICRKKLRNRMDELWEIWDEEPEDSNPARCVLEALYEGIESGELDKEMTHE